MSNLKPDDILKERYRILQLIGQGGMGAVYQAEDTRLAGRLTAVKEILFNLNDTAKEHEENRRQFHREASILARLDHPMLPKVSDFFIELDRDFLVMDFVAGQDLRQLIESAIQKNEFLPEDQILRWADQLADALSYLHAQEPPVLHRDIKPANIKMMPSGLIKLVDFGLVKLLDSDESRTITVVQGRGSAHYTPLEQYGGDTGHTDLRSDIYAFGATLYHLSTNRPPAEARQRFLTPHVLPDPRKYNEAISERTAKAIIWALSMHPDDRPRNVEEFREALLGKGRIPYMVTSGLARAEYKSTSEIIVYDADMAKGNVILAALATLLLIASIFVTFFSPTI